VLWRWDRWFKFLWNLGVLSGKGVYNTTRLFKGLEIDDLSAPLVPWEDVASSQVRTVNCKRLSHSPEVQVLFVYTYSYQNKFYSRNNIFQIVRYKPYIGHMA